MKMSNSNKNRNKDINDINNIKDDNESNEDQDDNDINDENDINEMNNDNDFIDDKDFIEDDKERDKNHTRGIVRRRTRSENEHDGRKSLFDTNLDDTVNQTADERLNKAVEVDLYVFDWENELQAVHEQIALQTGSAMLFNNLSNDPRRTLHNHRRPSNANDYHVVITFRDIIQQRTPLQYPYTFTTADVVPTTLGYMATAGM